MPVNEMAQALNALAETLEQGGRAADIPGQLQRLAQQHAAQARSRPGPEMEQLSTVLSAWHDVWGRMGHDAVFRGAVAREARVWAARCTAANG